MNPKELVRTGAAWGLGLAMGAGAAVALHPGSAPESELSPNPQAASTPAQNCPEPAGPGAAELERCEAQLAALRESPPAPSAEPEPSREPLGAVARQMADTASRIQNQGRRGARRIEEILARFDESRLREAGFSDRDIERLAAQIQRLEDQARFEREQAARDGEPAGRREERDLHDRIWDELRADYGDDTYDALLFATRQNNRAQVQDVVQDSPAAAAGLRAGDVIVYYDQSRVFSTEELRSATDPGATPARGTVRVEVLRDGERMTFFVPAGRMGIRVVGRSLPPGDG